MLPPALSRRFIVFIAVLSCIKLGLVSGLRIWGITDASYDDAHFVKLAINIIQGKWLGPYDGLTLAKGPVYSFFIALNHQLGTPLLVLEHLIYITAGVVLLVALAKHIKNAYALGAFFVFYLLNPAASILRVLREALYQSETTLVFAGLIGLWGAQRLHNRIGWAVLMGAGLALAWLTREEGPWMLPAILFVFAASAYRTLKERQPRRALLREGAVLALPFAILFASLQTISYVNRTCYGIYTYNEFKHRSFLEAYGALTRVKPAVWKPHVPMQEEVRKRVYAVSPAFRKLEPSLEAPGFWRGYSYDIYPDAQSDITGAWFIWALRDAVQAAGYYTAAPKAIEYYKRLTDEVNSACEDGRLQCGPWRATLVPSMQSYYLQELPGTFKTALLFFLKFQGSMLTKSFGGKDGIRLFEAVTHNKLYPLEIKGYTKDNEISGWAFVPGEAPVQIRLFPLEMNTTLTLERLPGEDVVKFFNDGSALHSRFRIKASCSVPCKLQYLDASARLLAEAPLGELPLQLATHDESLKIHIDSAAFIEATAAFSGIGKTEQFSIRMLTETRELFGKLMPVLAIVAFVWLLVSAILPKKKESWATQILCMALLLGILTSLAILSMIHITSFPALYYPSYMAPLYPLLFAFIALSMGSRR